MMTDTIEVGYSRPVGVRTAGPYIHIALRVLDREAPPFPALVDSGAAITNVPERYLKMLMPMQAASEIPIESFLGRVDLITPFYAGVVLQKEGSPWHTVYPGRGVIFRSHRAWLGRDVLDKFTVIMNGETVSLTPKL